VKDMEKLIEKASEFVENSEEQAFSGGKKEVVSDMEKIQDSTLVIDALDDPQTKLDVAQQCKAKHIHCVHGAIAGMHGQFSTDNTLEHLYPDGDRGAELSSGNPPFTVTLAASIQASEAIKCILGIGETLQGEFMVADLLYNDFEKFPL